MWPFPTSDFPLLLLSRSGNLAHNFHLIGFPTYNTSHVGNWAVQTDFGIPFPRVKFPWENAILKLDFHISRGSISYGKSGMCMIGQNLARDQLTSIENLARFIHITVISGYTSTVPNFYTRECEKGARKSALRKIAKIRCGRCAAVKVHFEDR